MIIPFDGPLDLPSTLESGQAFRWRRLEPEEQPSDTVQDEQRRLWFESVIYGNLVRVRRLQGGIEFFSSPDDESIIEPLLRDYLRLEDDLDSIYSSISDDRYVRIAIVRFKGLRLLRQEPWECLISFVCSANSNIPRISGNIEAMADAFGTPVTLSGTTRSTFPTPSRLADAGEHRLRELGLGFRAKYVASIAKVVSGGGIDLLALREADYEEALGALISLPGVGDKVANCVLLFSLEKLEAFPVDVWVQRVVADRYADKMGRAGEKKPSLKEMRLWAQEYFKPYAGYANQYLFHDRRRSRAGVKRVNSRVGR